MTTDQLIKLAQFIGYEEMWHAPKHNCIYVGYSDRLPKKILWRPHEDANQAMELLEANDIGEWELSREEDGRYCFVIDGWPVTTEMPLLSICNSVLAYLRRAEDDN